MVTTEALYLCLLGALAAERMGEMALSRANARSAFARGGYEVGREHFAPMAALHTLFFVAAAAEVVLLGRPFPGALGVVALAFALAAQALRYSAVFTLGKRWNVRIIVWPFAPPVTSGPYRFIRHPNYVAVALELFFVPLVHGAFVTALVFSVVNAWVLSIRIREEEQALGASYARAFRDRPRLVPKLFGR
jgi:methyltransferase